MTTIVRILAYSDATLFDMSEAASLKILGRFFAKFIAYSPRFGLKITTASNFQQNRSQNDPITGISMTDY